MAEALLEATLEDAAFERPSGDMSEWSLIECIAQMSAPSPVAGSGAAAAIALAMAAACAAKAFALSALHSGDGQIAGAASQARILAGIALEGAQRDGEDFRAWLKDHSRKHLAELSEDATALQDISARLLSLVTANHGSVSKLLYPDIQAALDLVGAFHSIEKRNIEANAQAQRQS